MKKLLAILMFAFTIPSLAQNACVNGHATLGGSQAVTSGMKSTNYLQGIIPSAKITVYLTGTTTKATIYSDVSGTPLANPFTANSATATDPGGWTFCAATSAGLDVVGSGGVSPNVYIYPVTLVVDVFPVASAGLPANGCSTSSGGNLNCPGTIMAGNIPITSGGTGATTAQGAATNIVDGHAINPSTIGATTAAASVTSNIDNGTYVVGVAQCSPNASITATTNDCGSALSAISVGSNPLRVRFPFVPGNPYYYFNAFDCSGSFPGAIFDVDPGAVLVATDTYALSAACPSLQFARPTMLYGSTLGMYYKTSGTTSSTGFRPDPTKSLWIAESDYDRSKVTALNATTNIIAYNISGDTWTTETFASVVASSATIAPGSVDGKYHIAEVALMPGQQYIASLNVQAGSPTLVAMVRTTGGYYGYYGYSSYAQYQQNASTGVGYFYKNTGSTAVTNSISPYWLTHLEYAPANSLWTIRLDDWYHASVLLNGRTVYVIDTTSQGSIYQVGLGMIATTSSDTIAVKSPVIVNGKQPTYGSAVKVQVFGDSRTAQRVDAWPNYLQEALDYSGGARNYSVINQAVGGDSCAQQYTSMQSSGIVGDVVVINVGTNDVQNLTGSAAFGTCISNMITTVKTAGALPILVNFGNWYTQTESGGTGQLTHWSGAGADYHSALMYAAGTYGVPVVDGQSIGGPIDPNWVNSALNPNFTSAGDPAVYDNIHPTTASNRAYAVAIAKAVLGALMPANDVTGLSNTLTPSLSIWNPTLAGLISNGVGTSQRVVSLGQAIPNGFTATKQASGDAGNYVATDSFIAQGGMTYSAANTLSGLPTGCVQYPCLVAKTAPTTYSGTSTQTTINYTTTAAGAYRVCAYIDVTAAGTAGTWQPWIGYTSDGHLQNYVISATAASSTQWSSTGGCIPIYADSGVGIWVQDYASGITGSPTIRHWESVEKTQ